MSLKEFQKTLNPKPKKCCRNMVLFPKALFLVGTGKSCTLMHFAALWCTLLHFDALCCTLMHFHAICCTFMQYDALSCNMMHFDALSCNMLHFDALSCNFKSYWFCAQTRKNLSLGFLLSFKNIKSFQNSIKITLIFIKILFHVKIR